MQEPTVVKEKNLCNAGGNELSQAEKIMENKGQTWVGKAVNLS